MTGRDHPSTYLEADEVRSEILWATAYASCEMVGITLDEMLHRTLLDKFPPSLDERVESISMIFGPPILRELALILKYQDDLAAEKQRREALSK